MQFSLLILAAPDSPGNLTAYRFARAALTAGHDVYRVFFYHRGVLTGNALNTPPQDEPDLTAQWRALASEYELDVVVCIASALRRGILNDSEAERQQKTVANLPLEFELAGLGQWADALIHSDRIISFGP